MSDARQTQSAAILRLLIEARGAWIPLPAIMKCAAQYNARLYEIRRLGFTVENKTEEIDGARHSWYRLVSSPAPFIPEPSKPAPAKQLANSLDWYERSTGQPRPSDKPKPKEDFGPLFEVRP